MKRISEILALLIFLTVTVTTVSGNIAERAAIYFSFEGDIVYTNNDPIEGLDISAPCLENKGNRGFGEKPYYKGVVPVSFGGGAQCFK